MRDRDWTFRVVPQRQAGHLQHCRLLLDTARVRQNDGRVVHQPQEVEIPERIDQAYVRAGRNELAAAAAAADQERAAAAAEGVFEYSNGDVCLPR